MNLAEFERWGWYSREDQRMHLQTVDDEHRNLYKVWLEEKGKRVFVPETAIPRKVLKPLQTAVENHRVMIDDRWVALMIDQHWIDLHVALPTISLVAYPNRPNKFVCKLDLRIWLTAEQLDTLKPEIISISREMVSLRLWTNRTDEQMPYDIRLSTLLWQN